MNGFFVPRKQVGIALSPPIVEEEKFFMQIRGTLMLLAASFFWGTTFVAQLTGMDGLGPFSYAAARYFIGFLSLLAVLLYTRKSRAVDRRQ